MPKKVYKRSSHKKGFEEVDTSALAEKFKDIYNKINEHGEPDFTQLDENEVYMQHAAEPERDLVAYHNISADNLRKALASGDLPVPSILAATIYFFSEFLIVPVDIGLYGAQTLKNISLAIDKGLIG